MALAVVLYSATCPFVRAESRLSAVSDDLRRGDRAVSRLRLRRLHCLCYLAPTLRPRSRACSSPARWRSLRSPCCSVAGAASTLAFFPREGDGRHRQASRRRQPPDHGAEQSEFERFMATAPRVPLGVPAEGAKVLIVKFNDYPVPGRAASRTWPTSRSWRNTQASHPGAVKMRAEGLSAEPGVQRRTCQTHASVGVRRGGRRAAGAAHNAASDRRVALHAPAGDDSGVWCGRRRATSARSRTSTRNTPRRSNWSRPTSRSASSSGSRRRRRSSSTASRSKARGRRSIFDQAIAYELQHARRNRLGARVRKKASGVSGA